jgi:hypothetical protein
VNSSLRAVLKRRRTSGKPLFFAKIERKIRDGVSPTWAGERIEKLAGKGRRLRNYPAASSLTDEGSNIWSSRLDIFSSLLFSRKC